MSHATPSNPDWHGWLCDTLARLREPWPSQWPGLAVVLDACSMQLWHGKEPITDDAKHMLSLARAMTVLLEAHNAQLPTEPHYHNRLHTADALVSLCGLLRVLQTQGHGTPDNWMACLLLAVASHDVQHPGGANAFAQQLEHHSVQVFQQLAQSHHLAPEWINTVSELILRTDPTLVAGNHDRVAGKRFVLDLDWATVLMNEADILASATERFGPELGRQLAQEWAWRELPTHAVVGTDAGRIHFLSSLRFSSPASLAMGMPERVQAQLNLLRAH